MADVMPSDEESDTGMESPPPDSTEDLASGYQLVITVTPSGFTLSDPQPLDAEPPDDGAPAPSSEDAASTPAGAAIADRVGLVKALIGVLEAHPIGEDANAQMKAGYEA